MVKDYTFALERRYHQMTADEMGKDLRALMEARPHVPFEALEAGHLAYSPPIYQGAGDDVFKVLKVMPKRTQLEAVRPGQESQPFKAYRGSYPGRFTILDDALASMLGLTHREIVEEAVRRGLTVPNQVRVYYPELFVTLPERFDAQRLIDTVKPQWGQKVTDLTVAAFIEERHRRIRQIESQMAKAVVLNPDTAPDYDRYIQGYMQDIDFYRWLLPHVSEGGALYI